MLIKYSLLECKRKISVRKIILLACVSTALPASASGRFGFSKKVKNPQELFLQQPTIDITRVRDQLEDDIEKMDANPKEILNTLLVLATVCAPEENLASCIESISPDLQEDLAIQLAKVKLLQAQANPRLDLYWNYAQSLISQEVHAPAAITQSDNFGINRSASLESLPEEQEPEITVPQSTPSLAPRMISWLMPKSPLTGIKLPEFKLKTTEPKPASAQTAWQSQEQRIRAARLNYIEPVTNYIAKLMWTPYFDTLEHLALHTPKNSALPKTSQEAFKNLYNMAGTVAMLGAHCLYDSLSPFNNCYIEMRRDDPDTADQLNPSIRSLRTFTELAQAAQQPWDNDHFVRAAQAQYD